MPLSAMKVSGEHYPEWARNLYLMELPAGVSQSERQ